MILFRYPDAEGGQIVLGSWQGSVPHGVCLTATGGMQTRLATFESGKVNLMFA